MSEDTIKYICEHYGIEDVCIGSFFDTSHGEEDIRYSYVTVSYTHLRAHET